MTLFVCLSPVLVFRPGSAASVQTTYISLTSTHKLSSDSWGPAVNEKNDPACLEGCLVTAVWVVPMRVCHVCHDVMASWPSSRPMSSVAVTVGPPRASVHSPATTRPGALTQSPSDSRLRLRPRVHGSYTLAAVTPVFIAATSHSPGQSQVHIITVTRGNYLENVTTKYGLDSLGCGKIE